MTIELLRRVALFHGILAWISSLALVIVALKLHRPHQRSRSIAALSTFLTALAFITGATLDLGYRVHLRQHLFLASRALGWLFERKLHFSFGALLLSLAALAALLATDRSAEDPAGKRLLASAKAGFIASALFALVACVASSLVAARARF